MICLNPNTSEPVEPCQADSIVYLTYSEVQALGGAIPWNLSLTEASLISGAVLLVWAAAFSIKVLIKALNSGDPE